MKERKEDADLVDESGECTLLMHLSPTMANIFLELNLHEGVLSCQIMFSYLLVSHKKQM